MARNIPGTTVLAVIIAGGLFMAGCAKDNMMMDGSMDDGMHKSMEKPMMDDMEKPMTDSMKTGM